MTTRGRPPKTVEAEPVVNYYGLLNLGFEDALPPSGDYRRDQIAIEALAFRISHDPMEGGLGKFRHCKNLIDLLYNHPEAESYKRFLWHEWSDAAIKEFCENYEVGLAGSTSSGKTNPAGLWAVLNFLVDPTHTKVFCLSTTIKEAKDRIWKEVVEYYEAIPNGPGNYLKSLNCIQGPSLSGKGFGTTSGIYLVAADRTNESEAVNALIGSKVAKTGAPTSDALELLMRPEYEDLRTLRRPDGLTMAEDQLLDLVMRLSEISDDRQGRIIIIIDEATGISDRILKAYYTNMKPGNPGRIQLIVIGNPSSRLDVHGVFCEPAAGWDSIHSGMGRWHTMTGGVCLHFHGERNPRITTGDQRLTWMPTAKENADVEGKYGRESLEYYRMVTGFWPPANLLHTLYTESDFIRNDALHNGNPGPQVVWMDIKPKILSGFDPAYSAGGDRAMVQFGKLGIDVSGTQTLETTESVTIKADISNANVPLAEQLLMRWKHECDKRHVPPENACFDASGGGISFAAIVTRMWSPRVRAVTSGGKPGMDIVPGEKLSDGKPMRSCDKYLNKATELWCCPLPYLRNAQIKGVPRELARELCSRQQALKKAHASGKVQVESKKDYKGRERHSPDWSDAWVLMVNEAKARHGFKVQDNAVKEARRPRYPGDSGEALTPWQQLRQKASRIANAKPLKRQ